MKVDTSSLPRAVQNRLIFCYLALGLVQFYKPEPGAEPRKPQIRTEH